MSLCDNRLLTGGTGAAQALALGLAQLTSLERLTLCHNVIDKHGAGVVALALGCLTALTYLDMGHTSISGSCLSALSSLTALEHLCLSGNNLECTKEEGLSALASGLQLPALRSLDLRNTSLRGREVQALAPALVRMSLLATP